MPPFRWFSSLRRRQKSSSTPPATAPPAAPPSAPASSSASSASPAPEPLHTPAEPLQAPAAQDMAAHTPIRAKLDALAADIDKLDPDLAKCTSLLTELKIALTMLPGLQPGAMMTEAAIPDVTVARDVYEVAALLSLKLEDEVSFERHVAQAKTYYVDFAGVIGTSPRQNLILGLNLMRLMAQNRIGEFHTELELVPSSARSDKYIDYALRLEHYLMEGSYSKIREEKIAVPDASFALFMDKLMDTLREEIADCSERAYQTLPVASAQRMLSLHSESEVVEFAVIRGWRIEDGVISFADKGDGKGAVEQIASSEIIERSLGYAKELEQII